MSDASNNANGGGASADNKSDSVENISMPKSAFDARLERERNAWMKELGVTSIDDVKSAIGAAKAASDAKVSDAEKVATARAALEFAQTENQKLSGTVKEYADSAMAGLSDDQRAAVTEAAGDDPAAQLKTIKAFQKTWAAKAPEAGSANGKPAIQDTLSGRLPPKENGNNGSAPDPKAVHAELVKTNPYFAARYASAHGLHIA